MTRFYGLWLWFQLIERSALIVCGYLAGFFALEKLGALLEPVLRAGAWPWRFSAGLNVALLLLGGVRYAPLVAAAIGLGACWFHPQVRLAAVVILALNTACGYGLGTLVLRRALNMDLGLRRMRDVVAFVGVAVATPLLVAAFAVADLVVFSVDDLARIGMIPGGNDPLKVLGWWIGDAFGIIGLAPFLLVNAAPGLRIAARCLETGHWADWRRQVPERTVALRWLTSIAAIAAVFAMIRGLETTRRDLPLLCLAFLPLIWISLQDGLPGASVGAVALCLGTVLMGSSCSLDGAGILHAQLLASVLSLSALLVGAMVSERSQVEEAMQGALRRRTELESIVNRSPMVVFLWRAAEGWPVEFVSENVSQFGYAPAEFIRGGVQFPQIVHSEDRDRVGTQASKYSEDGLAVHTREYRILTGSGDVRWVDDRTWVQRDARGQITHYQGILIDITERKWAEDKLRRSEERFRLLLQNVKDYAVFMLSPYGKVASWNEGAECILGYPAGEIVGENFSRFYASADLAAGQPEKHLETAMRKGSCEDEGWRTRKDGSRFWANVVLTVLHDDHGRVSGFSNVTRDMTERKRIEEELRRAKEAAEAGSRAKSEFLATLSHEIRRPVNEIIGMAGLLLDTELPPEQRQCAKMVKESAAMLLGSLNDILDLAKLEAGKMVVEPTRFDLRVVAEEVIEMLDPRARQKKLAVLLRYAPGTPQRVVGDPGRIRQVLVNLMDNAIKFTDAGQVTISVDCQERAREDAVLRISVQDTGMGIPEDKQTMIFEKFSCLNPALQRKYGGLGLGLTISRQIVEQMGGQMGMASQVREGSTFWFVLRLLLDPSPVPADQAAKPAGGIPPIFYRCRVLLAEDSVTDQQVAQMMLEKLGCRVDVAANGMEAVAMFDKLPYDLVFMDCQMPEMDGCQAAAEIRKRHPVGRRTPIIAITVDETEANRQKCLKAGMDDYLGKPVDLARMAELIEKWKARKE